MKPEDLDTSLEGVIDKGTLEKIFKISHSAVNRTFSHFRDIENKTYCLLFIEVILIGFSLVNIGLQLSFNPPELYTHKVILGVLAIISIILLTISAILLSVAMMPKIYQEIDISALPEFAKAFPEEITFMKKTIGDWASLQEVNLALIEATCDKISRSTWLLIGGILVGLTQITGYILLMIW